MSNLLDDLNDAQRQAVRHVDGPLLILAGAGSGKTRVITRRIAYLIEQGVAPWNVLAITFTNKAAEEMRHRVEALRAPTGTTVCTFHALCARLLREFSLDAGLAHNYSIYDRSDQLKIVKDAIKRQGVRADNFQPARVHSAISNAKNDLKTPDDLAAEAEHAPGPGRAAWQEAVAGLYRTYQKLLADNNALDFDDLLMRMAFLLRDHPDICELLSRRYRYVMIDEYQDTNRAQYLIAHTIAMDHHNICVTGDPDQSIYAWRGADIRNILEFEADYGEAVVIRMEENYRSTPPILAAASRLISRNTMRKDKALWTRREGGCDVRVVYCNDEHAEADEIARCVAAHVEASGAYQDAAVFYRVNALSRVLEQSFRRRSLPYRIARGVEFYNRKEVKDVLAYLRLLANPDDDLSCVRIINTPARGIGAVTVGKLTAAAEAGGRSLLVAAADPAEAALKGATLKKVAAFAEMIADLSGSLDGPVRPIVENVVRRSGIEAALDDAGEDARQARANVDELISNAAEFDEDNEEPTLAEFLHQVSLVSDLDHFDGAGGAVTFMTLHAAKGLEFPVVFIVGCESGLLPMVRNDFPGRGGRDAETALEEERRLAFVGMTRAKEQLTLSCARTRMIRGSRGSQVASTFLTEIGSELVTFDDITGSDGPADYARRARSRSRGGFYSDVDQRAAIEAAMDAVEPAEDADADVPFGDEAGDVAPPPAEYADLVVNCRIRHEKFGEGKVVGLRNHWPETRAEIIFDESGPKTIWLKHTRLEVLEQWD